MLKSMIEQKNPIIFVFFIIHFAKLRLLELYFKFFDKFCDVDKFEKLQMDTDSLNFALAEENLYDCIQPERTTYFKADAISKSYLEHLAVSIKSMISGNLGFQRRI